MSLNECWGRMLLSINGLSAHKVAGILAAYPTPMALWQAFREAEQIQREAEEAAASQSNVGKGKGRATKPKIALAEHLLTRIDGITDNENVKNKLAERLYKVFREVRYTGDVDGGGDDDDDSD